MPEEYTIPLELFVAESRKRLSASLEEAQHFGGMEQAVNRSISSDMVRTMRGLRGSAEFMGLANVARLSEVLERLLGKLRDKQMALDEASVTAILSGLTKLHSLFDDVANSDSVPIESEVAAIQARLESAILKPAEAFDLYRYPDAVIRAVHLGLFFYVFDLSLPGTCAEKRAILGHLKESVSAIGSLIDSVPDLGMDIEMGDDCTTDRVQLLFSTVLQKELLLGLTSLPPERIHPVLIPDVLRQSVLVATEEASSVAIPDDDEIPPSAVPLEDIHSSDLEQLVGQDPLTQWEQLPEPVEEARQDATEEQNQQENDARTEQRCRAMEAQAKEEELLATAPAKRSKRLWFVISGAVAAGILTVFVVSEQRPSWLEKPPVQPSASVQDKVIQDSPPALHSQESLDHSSANRQEEKRAASDASAGRSEASPTDQSNRAVVTGTDSTPIVRPVTAPLTVSAPVPSQTSPTLEQPSKSEPAPKPAAVLSAVENVQPVPLLTPAVTNTDTKPSAPTLAQGRTAPADVSASRPSLAVYSHLLSPMKRLLNSPYERVKPPKGKPRGDLTFHRDQGGDIGFSVDDIMGHTASRSGESFTITPKTVTELRLVFQVDPNEAYIFKFDEQGRVSVPRAFWASFSQISQRAVSLSREIATSSDGVRLRDLSALPVNFIVKHVDR